MASMMALLLAAAAAWAAALDLLDPPDPERPPELV